MARNVKYTPQSVQRLHDRAASIRWMADRVANEFQAEDLRQLADALDAQASTEYAELAQAHKDRAG